MDTAGLLVLSALLGSLGVALLMRRRRRRRVKRKYWVRPWLRRRESGSHQNMMDFYKELLVDGDVQEFRSTLRMSPETYFNLLELLRPSLTKQHTNFRRPISPETRLAMTMRYLALGECFRSLSQQFRIGLSTTRVIVRETCRAIARTLRARYLRTPMTTDEWMLVATEFEEKWNFPNCLGALDGKHIRIIAPRNTGSFFYNYKDYYSIVLLAVVSADYQFLYLDIGSEGKASDGGIWAKSTFHEHLQDPSNPLGIPAPQNLNGNSIPYCLVADDAFRLGPHIMRPYPGFGLTRKQQIFNYRLSRARRIVENGFGILSCRFKIFRRAIEVNPDFVVDLVMASCILHNYLRQNARDNYIPLVSVDHELQDGNVVAGAWRQEVTTNMTPMQKDSQKNASDYAKRIRNHLSDYFLTKEGEVPWQYKKSLF